MPATSSATARLEEAKSRLGSVIKSKWRLERLLGVGGMGAVYEARHRNGDRVAIKVMHASAHDAPRQAREAYAANRVGHPGAVRVLDDDTDENGISFLVMDLLQGDTLAKLAERAGGRMVPMDVLDHASRLLDVLASAHAHRIFHLDVKPENLFLTTEGELRVLDFGIAHMTDEAAPGAEIRAISGGTPGYMAPEQARGCTAEIDGRSDVWAVGATMFRLVTGRSVHAGANREEAMGLAMTADAPPVRSVLPELSRGIAAVIDRALRYAPDQRWQSARDMRDAVDALRRAVLRPMTASRAPSPISTYSSDATTTLSRPIPPAPNGGSGLRAWLGPSLAIVLLAALPFVIRWSAREPVLPPPADAARAPARLLPRPAPSSTPAPVVPSVAPVASAPSSLEVPVRPPRPVSGKRAAPVTSAPATDVVAPREPEPAPANGGTRITGSKRDLLERRQ